MEFPRYSGQDIDTWILKAEKYFALDETPAGMKVSIASLHLDDASFPWQVANERRWGLHPPSWEEYVEMLRGAFGQPVERPMTELTHLRQTGSLADFQVRFDSIVAKLDLPEDYLVDAYLGALKSEIGDAVLMFNPSSLGEARRLARIQEVALSRKSTRPTADRFSRPTSSSFSSQLPSSNTVGFVPKTASFNGYSRKDSVLSLPSNEDSAPSGPLETEPPHAEDSSFRSASVSSLLLASTNAPDTLPLANEGKYELTALGCSGFDFSGSLQACSYRLDSCEAVKQTPSNFSTVNGLGTPASSSLSLLILGSSPAVSLVFPSSRFLSSPSSLFDSNTAIFEFSHVKKTPCISTTCEWVAWRDGERSEQGSIHARCTWLTLVEFEKSKAQLAARKLRTLTWFCAKLLPTLSMNLTWFRGSLIRMLMGSSLVQCLVYFIVKYNIQ